jgi:hypothetical protein
MTTKKTDDLNISELYSGTRRDVMKLSMAVAAFGAAMGIAGPSAAAPGIKNKTEADKFDRTGRPKIRDKTPTDNSRTGRPKERDDSPRDTSRTARPKERDKEVSTSSRRRGPKVREKEATND